MIKMAQLENIRKMYYMEDLSIRKLAVGLVYTGILSQNIYPWKNQNPKIQIIKGEETSGTGSIHTNDRKDTGR